MGGAAPLFDLPLHHLSYRSRNYALIVLPQPQVLNSDAVLVVASQQLIAALPRQNDFDVPAGEFRDKVQRHTGWMRNRFVLLIDERRKLTEELLGRDDNFVMIRFESSRYNACVI